MKARICHIPSEREGLFCEPSSDADGAQLTDGRSDDGAVDAICKTKHHNSVHRILCNGSKNKF